MTNRTRVGSVGLLAIGLGLPACAGGSNVGAPSGVAAGGATEQAGTCPAAWLAAPMTDPSIAPPDGGTVLLHAVGLGTQAYACTMAADGGSSWTFVGPEADLVDCRGTRIGHHFASDGGATAPQWQTTDGSYVVGRKLAAFTPDGGAASVPWLLLQSTGKGGSGPLGSTAYVERVGTDGGLAPAGPCAPQAIARVPYSADYYFVAP